MTDKTRTFTTPRDLLERALNSERGIRIWFDSQKSAQSMSNRIATVKSEDRKKSTKVYSLGDPLYNTSLYDGVAVYTQPVEVFQGEKPEGYPTSGVWLYLCPAECASQGLFVEEL